MNSPAGDKLARITREAWRELGFWYDCDVKEKRWTFRADRRGIAAFATEVHRFLSSPEADEVGEHAHLGPYSNLRLICAEQALIDWRGLAGRRNHFERFATELETIAGTSARGSLAIAAGFAGAEGFRAIMVVEDDDFDPASADRTIDPE